MRTSSYLLIALVAMISMSTVFADVAAEAAAPAETEVAAPVQEVEAQPAKSGAVAGTMTREETRNVAMGEVYHYPHACAEEKCEKKEEEKKEECPTECGEKVQCPETCDCACKCPEAPEHVVCIVKAGTVTDEAHQMGAMTCLNAEEVAAYKAAKAAYDASDCGKAAQPAANMKPVTVVDHTGAEVVAAEDVKAENHSVRPMSEEEAEEAEEAEEVAAAVEAAAAATNDAVENVVEATPEAVVSVEETVETVAAPAAFYEKFANTMNPPM